MGLVFYGLHMHMPKNLSVSVDLLTPIERKGCLQCLLFLAVNRKTCLVSQLSSHVFLFQQALAKLSLTRLLLLASTNTVYS